MARSKNPISNVRSDDKEDFDFLIAALFAEKVTHKVAQLIREGNKFAVLVAVDLLPQIKVTKTKEDDELVQQCLLSMPTILIAPLALVWLVNHPDYRLPEQGHVVLYGTPDRASTEGPTRKWKRRFGCHNDRRTRRFQKQPFHILEL